MSSLDVLIVDDEEEIRSYLTLALQDYGLAVKSASTGMEALAIAHQEQPQMVILDLMMPEMAGDEVCKIIKQDSELQNTIVFMLTARNDLESKLACFKSGADEYLVKPIDGRELTARVGRFFRLINQLKTQSRSPADASTAEIRAPYDSIVEFKSLVVGESFLKSVVAKKTSYEPKTKYGAYRVENLVGKGGMGQVVKGYDELLDRPVAIKILSPRFANSPEFVERFRREAKVLAAMNHPGIAGIYTIGEQKGEHFFAMQWCPNGSLSDMIRKQNRIELLPAVDVVLQSARALAAALKKGVVHRDIKPSNLMFDENQMIKVVDFGLAHAENFAMEVTQASDFMGTPAYMAPEQAVSPAVDHRADIYSLGITFYYMIYGKLPYSGRSPMEMVIKHTTHPFPPFDSLDGKIPRSAYDIIERMTQKQPEARYQDYATLIRDLEGVRNELLRERQFRLPRAAKISATASFSGANLFDLLTTLYNEPQSGVLTARWAALEKRFFIRHREIVHFESPLQDESLWDGLVRNRLLKPEDVPAPTSNMEEQLNRMLLNQVFSLPDLRKTLRELMKAAVIQVFFWPVFEGEFFPADIQYDAINSVTIADLMLEASRNFMDLQKMSGEVSSIRPLFCTSQFDQVLASLNLKPEESFVASRMEGQQMALSTLISLTGLPEERVVRIVFPLLKMGALQFKEPLLMKSLT